MDKVEAVIIGAGVIGLAIASEIVREDREVYVFVLPKGRKFTRNGRRGFCLEKTFPYRTVRYEGDGESSRLWAYEKVILEVRTWEGMETSDG